ncbi:transcriptional adapter ADA2b [Arachis duranensis]|uniref:Transcriptional adapter n=1 Tax=Arachis duranensis TaxID=130453 RepID=A0A6P4BZ82_ARADU|nr:transcriptional adapter ADA2b [Arachis duranensis]
MGRCRAASRPADDDPNLRSKKKKAALNVENLDTSSPDVAAQGVTDGKGALYHCNYCNKDISGMIRIKCAVCQDFDLCIECFSVGAEVTPHKSNHPYMIMDNLSFPLITPDWNADEEMLLLEGIEMYGFGNWNEVAEYVGTKSKSQCIDHYNAIYMNSPCFPLPDLSHVMGKNKEELLEMAKGHEVKKGLFLYNLKSQDHPFNADGVKVEEYQSDRSIGEKKPKLSGKVEPSVTELSGYSFKREEFEIEYDNDAEQVLADMEFKDIDTESEREMKLHVLHIYSRRLDERKRRKNFILERNLLYPDPFEKSLSPEEVEICQRYKVFTRFHSKEEHMELLKNIIEEHRLIKRIQDLQEAHTAGYQTSTEAYKFIEQKKKEAERVVKENNHIGVGAKILPRPNYLKGELDSNSLGLHKDITAPLSGVKYPAAAIQDISRSLEEWDISGFAGAELLSESEINLCNEIRILPSHYFKMQNVLSSEISKGNISKKCDAHRLFKVEPSKVDRVYDMLIKKGIASSN